MISEYHSYAPFAKENNARKIEIYSETETLMKGQNKHFQHK